MKRATTKKSDKNNWKFLEHTIEVLEQAISPDAIVERNVYLLDLYSKSNRKRQCDIVIRAGKPPRETITIVEVQDRNKKVNIATFDGWVVKLDAVGAQHLICVSRHKFPKSIREKALQSGTKIRLMTFCDSPDKIPKDLIPPTINFRYPIYKSISGINLFISTEFDKINSDELNLDTKIFQINNTFLSLNDIIGIALSKATEAELPKLDIQLDRRTNSIFNVIIGDEVYELQKIAFQVVVEYETINVPISIITYEQELSGAIAWMLEGKAKMNGEEIIIKVPVHKNNEGYEIRAFSIPNFKHPLLNVSFKSEPI